MKPYSYTYRRPLDAGPPPLQIRRPDVTREMTHQMRPGWQKEIAAKRLFASECFLVLKTCLAEIELRCFLTPSERYSGVLLYLSGAFCRIELPWLRLVPVRADYLFELYCAS